MTDRTGIGPDNPQGPDPFTGAIKEEVHQLDKQIEAIRTRLESTPKNEDVEKVMTALATQESRIMRWLMATMAGALIAIVSAFIRMFL